MVEYYEFLLELYLLLRRSLIVVFLNLCLSSFDEKVVGILRNRSAKRPTVSVRQNFDREKSVVAEEINKERRGLKFFAYCCSSVVN